MIRALPERSMPLTCCSSRGRSWDSGRYGTNTIGKDRGGLLLRFAVSAAMAISLGVETVLHSTAKRKAFFPHLSSITASTWDGFGRALRIGSRFTATSVRGDTSTRPWVRSRSISASRGVSRYCVTSSGSRYIQFQLHSYYGTYSFLGILPFMGKYPVHQGCRTGSRKTMTAAGYRLANVVARTRISSRRPNSL